MLCTPTRLGQLLLQHVALALDGEAQTLDYRRQQAYYNANSDRHRRRRVAYGCWPHRGVAQVESKSWAPIASCRGRYVRARLIGYKEAYTLCHLQ